MVGPPISEFTTVFRLATKDHGHAIDGLGRVGERGNKTHLVFRDKVAANDRGFSPRPHETRLPPGHIAIAHRRPTP
jgi:hypothetical protein